LCAVDNVKLLCATKDTTGAIVDGYIYLTGYLKTLGVKEKKRGCSHSKWQGSLRPSCITTIKEPNHVDAHSPKDLDVTWNEPFAGDETVAVYCMPGAIGEEI
jgi:hypothetical protein